VKISRETFWFTVECIRLKCGDEPQQAFEEQPISDDQTQPNSTLPTCSDDDDNDDDDNDGDDTAAPKHPTTPTTRPTTGKDRKRYR